MSLKDLSHDRTGFYGLVADFPDQVLRTVVIAESAPLPSWKAVPDNVFLAGMGGSAAGGDFVKALFDTQSKVPFGVSRDYSLPSWVGSGSLGFVTSYSGNTEETLDAYDFAKRKGASLICVTSGGELGARAKSDGFPVIVVPGGQAPRTALGYMLVPVVVAASKMGLIDAADWKDVDGSLRAVLASCARDVDLPANPAKRLAMALNGTTPVVYGQGPLTNAVANRWRGQINENSKCMCLTHVFPELCHNEILGWQCAAEQGNWSVVLLEDGSESERLKVRVKETLDLIGAVPNKIASEGKSALAKMLSLAYFGDFVSIYLAELMSQDPAQMTAIDELKRRLSAVPR